VWGPEIQAKVPKLRSIRIEIQRFIPGISSFKGKTTKAELHKTMEKAVRV
jgi:hypothetical protein